MLPQGKASRTRSQEKSLVSDEFSALACDVALQEEILEFIFTGLQGYRRFTMVVKDTPDEQYSRGRLLVNPEIALGFVVVGQVFHDRAPSKSFPRSARTTNAPRVCSIQKW